MTKSAARKVAARKARSLISKSTGKARSLNSKSTGKARDKHHKTAPAEVHKKVGAETVRDNHRKSDAQFPQLGGGQVPDPLRVLAERNVAQTREQYEGSKNTLKAALESWEKSFGAAGQRAVAFNRNIIDIAERNINTGFDLVTGLAGAKNLAEVMELQAAYWRKLLGTVQSQVKEGRARTGRSKAT